VRKAAKAKKREEEDSHKSTFSRKEVTRNKIVF